MMISKYLRLLALVILLIFLSLISINCHYTFNPNLPSHIQEISVPIFKNETVQYGLETELTSRVVDEFISDGTLDLVDRSEADAILWGFITKYRLEPVSFDSDEIVDEYRLVLSVSVKFEDANSKEILWEEESISESVSFYPGGVGGSGALYTEAEAFKQVIEYIAVDVVRLTVEGWW